MSAVLGLTRRRPTKPRVLEDRCVQETWHANGRKVVRGQALSITGERGRFTFVAYVRTAAGVEWIDCLAPKGGGFRSFRPARVRTVHVRQSS